MYRHYIIRFPQIPTRPKGGSALVLHHAEPFFTDIVSLEPLMTVVLQDARLSPRGCSAARMVFALSSMFAADGNVNARRWGDLPNLGNVCVSYVKQTEAGKRSHDCISGGIK